MGNSYTNITLLGPEHNAVLLELKNIGRRAYISPTADGKTIVYDKESDELAIDTLNSLAADLSGRLDCAALATLVFDDDVLCLQLFENSTQTVNYISRGGSRAGAWSLCRTFKCRINFPLVLFVMQIPFMLFESWRHSIIAKLLGIPVWVVATGYRYIQNGELPPHLSEEDLEYTFD
jgi:hypothetical protein